LDLSDAERKAMVPERKRRRGMTLMEVLVATMVLGLTVVLAMAIFPFSAFLQDRAGGYSRASTLLQKKLEQLRRLDSKQFTTAGLRTAGVIDPTESASGPYSFTTVDNVGGLLVQGTGTMRITGAGTDLVQAEVQINWNSSRGKAHSVQALTLVADKSIWREP
jgi:prepilin-type N-terminal cleavage/methylation domain-containing protein